MWYTEDQKNRSLQVFEELEISHFQKLLREMELRNQKPLQLLRRKRDLARAKIRYPTLHTMWKSHLPAVVQAVLQFESKRIERFGHFSWQGYGGSLQARSIGVWQYLRPWLREQSITVFLNRIDFNLLSELRASNPSRSIENLIFR